MGKLKYDVWNSYDIGDKKTTARCMRVKLSYLPKFGVIETKLINTLALSKAAKSHE